MRTAPLLLPLLCLPALAAPTIRTVALEGAVVDGVVVAPDGAATTGGAGKVCFGSTSGHEQFCDLGDGLHRLVLDSTGVVGLDPGHQFASPGDGTTLSDVVTLNAEGDFVFTARDVVIARRGGVTSVVAAWGAADPGGGTYRFFDLFPQITSDGRVAFVELDNSFVRARVFAEDGSFQVHELVVRDTVQAGNAHPLQFLDLPFGFADDGTVFAMGRTTLPDDTTTGHPAGQLTVLAGPAAAGPLPALIPEGSDAPGHSPGSKLTEAGLGAFARSGVGVVNLGAFDVDFLTGGNLYRLDAGALSVIVPPVDSSSTADGTTLPGDALIAEDGTIVMRVDVYRGGALHPALERFAPGSTSGVVVAEAGGVAPGVVSPFSDALFGTPDAFAVDDDGDVAFQAELADGRQGVFATVDGVLRPVVLTGDSVTVAPGDARTVRTVIMISETTGAGPQSYAGNDLVFNLGFADGSSGVFVFGDGPPPPPPSRLSALASSSVHDGSSVVDLDVRNIDDAQDALNVVVDTDITGFRDGDPTLARATPDVGGTPVDAADGGCSVAGQHVHCTLAVLHPGQDLHVAVESDDPARPNGSVPGNASADNADPVIFADGSPLVTLGAFADLAVEVSAAPDGNGGTGALITLTNLGVGDADAPRFNTTMTVSGTPFTSVTVQPLDGGAACEVTLDGVQCTAPTLQPGDAVGVLVLTSETRVSAGVHVEASSLTSDADDVNDIVDGTVEMGTEVQSGAPDLLPEVQLIPAVVHPGDAATLELTVRNQGSLPDTGVHLVAAVDGFVLVGAGTFPDRCTPTLDADNLLAGVDCDAGRVDPDGLVVFDIPLSLPAAGGVQVSAEASGDLVDADPSNNSTDFSFSVEEAGAETADVSVAIQPVGDACIGSTVTFVVKNAGPKSAADVRLTFSVVKRDGHAAAFDAPDGCSGTGCTLGELPPGGIVDVNLRNLAGGDLTGSTITADVTTSTDDPVVDNNHDEATADLHKPSDCRCSVVLGAPPPLACLALLLLVALRFGRRRS